MTSLKLKFRPSRVGGKAGTVYIQVIHGRVVRQIGTGCRIHPHEWADGQVAVQDRETGRGRYPMASDGTVTLKGKDGVRYSDIRLSELLPAGYAGQCILAQLVTYMGRTYAGGSVAWHGMELYECWCSRRLFYGIEDREIDDACDTFFNTRDGRRLCLPSDLFGEPTAEEIQAYDPAADVDEFFDWMDCHADIRQEFIRR